MGSLAGSYDSSDKTRYQNAMLDMIAILVTNLKTL